MAGEAREKCAVGGILLEDQSKSNASAYLYEIMFALQHRGSEASGMASMAPNSELHSRRNSGLVVDVYDTNSINALSGNVAIGHNRYSTSGRRQGHPQPVVDEPLGFAQAHNGNYPDTSLIEVYLDKQKLRHGHLNDSEKAALATAQMMRKGKSLPDAVEQIYPMLTGAFSSVAIHDDQLVAFRDPRGIRPLAIGRFGTNWAVSSETCGLDIISADYVREVLPGEMVVITRDGIESKQLAEGKQMLDAFEFVYFARHDSKLYGKVVNEVRRNFGKQLALLHGALHDDGQNVVVVPVPDTAIPEAEGYANALNLRHTQAIIKNRYIGRTFMLPTTEARQTQHRRKHNIIEESVRDRHVILIDDSIVRLNTMPNLAQRIKAIGAKSVSVLIGSPPIRFPDFYGIDTPSQDELAAANMTIEQMRAEIQCHYLGFLSVDATIKAIDVQPDMLNLSCFTGEYPIDIGARKKHIRRPVSMTYAE